MFDAELARRRGWALAVLITSLLAAVAGTAYIVSQILRLGRAGPEWIPGLIAVLFCCIPAVRAAREYRRLGREDQPKP